MGDRTVDLRVDVTDAAGLGEPAHLAVTVVAPEGEPSGVVAVMKPGGGYGRRYFTEDLPGPGSGAQADWHAERGWVVLAVDHLGVGDSSADHDGDALRFTALTTAAHAAEAELLRRLAAGELVDGLAPVVDPVVLGVGQSMGGALTIVQQGRHHAYDGIAVLGYSPLHTEPPTAPGLAPFVMPWVPRDTAPSNGVSTNGPALVEAGGEPVDMAWGFHFDDVPPEVVARDLDDFPFRHGDVPPWGSGTVPLAAAIWCLAPGSTLAEAAAVRVPVLVAVGERDVVPDPRGDVRAYGSSPSVDLFVCGGMAHMHNFAGTRERLWQRLHAWGEWVAVSGG